MIIKPLRTALFGAALLVAAAAAAWTTAPTRAQARVAQASQHSQFETLDHMGVLRTITGDRGKVVVINFFASWCGPCNEEVPVLVRLRKEFDENEVAIHGLSIDEDSTALSLFVKRMDMNYPVALASETAQQVFHVNSIPMTLIYDKKGALITARQGLLSYESLQYALQTLSEAN